MISKNTSDQGDSPAPTDAQMTVSEYQDSDGKDNFEKTTVHYLFTKEVSSADDGASSCKNESRRGSDDPEPSLDVRRRTAAEKVDNMAEIGLHALHIEDDPSLNPWTFRTWFIGLGLSALSSSLATVYMFKPQGVGISTIFLCVISYVIALAMEFIPRRGWLGRFLNPHPFNSKEHAAILIMSSTAAHAAKATQVLAVQKLWYHELPNTVICILLIFSSQCLGYGIAGVLRKALVYPTKFVHPGSLPLMSLLETLHRKRKEVRPQLKLFYWSFACMFVWEVMPQYVMPLLTGVSIFCLVKQNSMHFTRIFGGANGNEGLGLFSLCFDFQYIGSSALFIPLTTHVNAIIGICLNVAVCLGMYYGNVWRAKDFPLLSQLLFSPKSNSTHYVVFQQNKILDADGVVDDLQVKGEGIPYMAASFAQYVLTENLAITATITHMLLYNWDDLKTAWSFISLSNLRKLARPETWMPWKKVNRGEPTEKEAEREDIDPHYRLMLKYKPAPDWWFGVIFLVATVCGLVCIQATDSGMQWWAFIIAIVMAWVFILFIGAQSAITGFGAPVTSVIQMIGAYMEPGEPLANMYFTLFGATSVYQGLLLLADFKLAQYAKLSPRCTLTMQLVGTLFGGVINYAVMMSITEAQRDILLSIEGTHIWSGAHLQSFNTQAVTWGGLSKYMYSWGSTYQWVPMGLVLGFAAPLPLYFAHRYMPKYGFDKVNIPIIAWHIGYLVSGINSSIMMYFLIAFWSQFYLRRYKPEWFLKFNYVLCAGFEGGTQVIIFILTFAFLGASGKPVTFPTYWGNRGGNVDFCMTDPAA
ncbi:OPT oligopeptide transporter protein-domain-containing protein [Apiospora arundinis]|uniref:OPT oligopeptide transporter protein-domain-containing protein n=1 Tax=Apiospora arundinis TaxID=335852 RepID=A0ABR2IU31_9PEZI